MDRILHLSPKLFSNIWFAMSHPGRAEISCLTLGLSCCSCWGLEYLELRVHLDHLIILLGVTQMLFTSWKEMFPRRLHVLIRAYMPKQIKLTSLEVKCGANDSKARTHLGNGTLWSQHANCLKAGHCRPGLIIWATQTPSPSQFNELSHAVLDVCEDLLFKPLLSVNYAHLWLVCKSVTNQANHWIQRAS